MFTRLAVPKNPRLAPCPLHTSLFCPFPPLCFQSLTTVKFSKPFVLITIRNAGGGRTASSLARQQKLQLPSFRIPCHLPWCPVSAGGVSGDLFPFCQLSTVNCQPLPVTPLECALTRPPSKLFILQRLGLTPSPLESALTQK